MHRRKKPVLLVLDCLPAHKRAIVREYVASTDGLLSLHFLPGYAPDLNPDELVWSHVKRTGTARLRFGRASNCATVSMRNSPPSATIENWCAHSSKRPLSPIFVTAE